MEFIVRVERSGWTSGKNLRRSKDCTALNRYAGDNGVSWGKATSRCDARVRSGPISGMNRNV
jgi:hypothetical protein